MLIDVRWMNARIMIPLKAWSFSFVHFVWSYWTARMLSLIDDKNNGKSKRETKTKRAKTTNAKVANKLKWIFRRFIGFLCIDRKGVAPTHRLHVTSLQCFSCSKCIKTKLAHAIHGDADCNVVVSFKKSTTADDATTTPKRNKDQLEFVINRSFMVCHLFGH